jgi:SAM-dependent methyltransferase
MWLPRLACPDCREPLAESDGGAHVCPRCGVRYERRGGILRFLSTGQLEAMEPFINQYRAVRQRDGYRETAPEYCRMLPVVAPTDPHAAEWRIRRESYAHLQQRGLPGIWRGPVQVLDLGAGNGWLSHRLASLGHRAVALDQLDDEADGLGACRHYPVSFAAVQADFNALPFMAGQFDVVVLNGSLHYSPDPAATLVEARRVLVDGGTIVVMDSPMFRRARDGEAMVSAQMRSFASDYGVQDAVRPGVGFLTFGDLRRWAQSLGLQGRFIPSLGPWGWRIRRQVARLRLRRQPAAFGVWVAQ